MLPLPAVAPVMAGSTGLLGRVDYVRIDSSDYSVDPAVIGRFIGVAADLTKVEVR